MRLFFFLDSAPADSEGRPLVRAMAAALAGNGAAVDGAAVANVGARRKDAALLETVQ